MLTRGEGGARAIHVGIDRQFAPTAIDQHYQIDRPRAAIVKNLIHRRAYGAPGIKNVIDQQQMAIVNIEGQLRGRDGGMHADTAEIVAIKGDIEFAYRSWQFELLLQLLCKPYPAGANANQGGFVESLLLDACFQARGDVGDQGVNIELFEFMHNVQRCGRRRKVGLG